MTIRICRLTDEIQELFLASHLYTDTTILSETELVPKNAYSTSFNFLFTSLYKLVLLTKSTGVIYRQWAEIQIILYRPQWTQEKLPFQKQVTQSRLWKKDKNLLPSSQMSLIKQFWEMRLKAFSESYPKWHRTHFVSKFVGFLGKMSRMLLWCKKIVITMKDSNCKEIIYTISTSKRSGIYALRIKST